MLGYDGFLFALRIQQMLGAACSVYISLLGKFPNRHSSFSRCKQTPVNRDTIKAARHFCFGRSLGPCDHGAYQPAPIHAPPTRKSQLRQIARPLWPRCLLAFGLYGPSCSEASASAYPTALVASLLISLRTVRPISTAAFSL